MLSVAKSTPQPKISTGFHRFPPVLLFVFSPVSTGFHRFYFLCFHRFPPVSTGFHRFPPVSTGFHRFPPVSTVFMFGNFAVFPKCICTAQCESSSCNGKSCICKPVAYHWRHVQNLDAIVFASQLSCCWALFIA